MPGVREDHIRAAFEEIDFDKNGFIGVSELRFMLMAMGERPTDAELDEMIRMLDSSGDGQVSYADFLTMFLPDSAVLQEMLTHKPPPSRHEGLSQEEIDRINRNKFTGTAPQVDTLLKTGWGFQHALNSKQREEKLLKSQPARRDPHPAATRARPEPPKGPLPLSPGLAQKARLRRERAEKYTKGGTSMGSTLR